MQWPGPAVAHACSFPHVAGDLVQGAPALVVQHQGPLRAIVHFVELLRVGIHERILPAKDLPAAESGGQRSDQRCTQQALGQQGLMQVHVDATVQQGQGFQFEGIVTLLPPVQLFAGNAVSHVMRQQFEFPDIQKFHQGLSRIQLAREGIISPG